MTVTATAYNSVPEQTSGDPQKAAWGDILAPGMKAIAVSDDLIAMGLTHETKVTIKGLEDEYKDLEGEYRVLDKMADRFEQRIDIYMGKDVERAQQWGEREVYISWCH